MDIHSIKQRFEIIGKSKKLERAIYIAMEVASTDLSVLITGESGVGKESFPKIIHQFSARKHASYIAVNCGAIPEGTIDSELFGHLKGSFTGALSDRKGYFQEADNGTIFLDEIAELPISTQVRLLRVLESGEFIKVGSSKVQKTNVRIIAATNVNIQKAIISGKFREDLYYRLNTVPLHIPPLRERKEDIYLLFRKFAADFADKYHMPIVSLEPESIQILKDYRWPGNIRQLKNITEQISVIEKIRTIPAQKLNLYLPENTTSFLPAVIENNDSKNTNFSTEREILYKVLFDMKQDMNDLKKLVFDLMKKSEILKTDTNIIQNPDFNKRLDTMQDETEGAKFPSEKPKMMTSSPIEDTEEYVEESLSIAKKEKELIIKALKKYKGKRRAAAKELGVSERTLYRKIKEYQINKNEDEVV